MFWVGYVFVLAVLSGVSDTLKTYDVDGAYDEDVLIGQSVLMPTGSIADAVNDYHRILLLFGSGKVDIKDLDEGYFMGFQWYNSEDESFIRRVNLQLYRPVNSTIGLQGQYKLAYETGWIVAEPGFNVYYFNEAIQFDKYDDIGDVYYMAMLCDRVSQVSIPVVYEHKSGCNANSRHTILGARTDKSPCVGDTLLFEHKAFPDCADFSLQGIYKKDHKASSTSGRCTMHTAHFENPQAIQDIVKVPWDRQKASYCRKIRADKKEGVDIKITRNYLLLPICEQFEDVLQIYSNNPLDDYGRHIGKYCQGKEFDSVTIGEKYADIYLEANAYSNKVGYSVNIETIKHSLKTGEIVGIAIGCLFAVLIVIFIIVMLMKRNRKQTQTVTQDSAKEMESPKEQLVGTKPPTYTSPVSEVPPQYNDCMKPEVKV